jgi:DNA polymerase III subunit epsilon
LSLKLIRPLVFFDIESTGLSITRDRMVEVAFLKVQPDGSTEFKRYLLNPGIPIPAEVSSIHGITDEDVRFAPKFEQVAGEMFEFLQNSDLAGFNALRFDIPMLAEEFFRLGLDLDVDKRQTVDVQLIFHKMEERNLSAAYRFYCQKELENAHSAEADIRATWEVFQAQIQRYDSLPETVQGIAEFTGNHLRVDMEGKLIKGDDGFVKFNFGKHKGRNVADVFRVEPSYYSWMMDGDFPAYTKKIITGIKLNS